MSKTKTKVSDAEQNYNFQGGGKKLHKDKNEIKNSFKKSDKLVIHKEFEPLFKNSVIKLLSNIKHYTNSLECQLCHKEIQDTMNPNYFHLHTEDFKNFITFHFLCALKPNSIEQFQEIMGRYDYISHIDH